jgi:hypothetical protein
MRQYFGIGEAKEPRCGNQALLTPKAALLCQRSAVSILVLRSAQPLNNSPTQLLLSAAECLGLTPLLFPGSSAFL